MNPCRLVIVMLAALLSGCLSHEGTYSPACIAYAGSNITLGDGQFLWEKFTDQVVVDDEGEIVNQFPGYPMRGSYRIDRQSVHMESASGEPMQTMYLHRHDGQQYLLTTDEYAEFEKIGKLADCALRLNSQTES
jgi:hypothetical protein